MEESATVKAITPCTTKGVMRQKRKISEPSVKAGDHAEAPNKGYKGVRWRRYPYGMRFIPRVRVPKRRYELPLGEYRTCEEAALVRDVASFYYGKKAAFNFNNDYPSFLPEIPSHLSGQEKIDWVSAQAKERVKTMFPKPRIVPPSEAFVSSELVAAAPLPVTFSTGNSVRKSWPATVVPVKELSEVQSHTESMVPHPDFWNLPQHPH